jgi:hypothetical protein
MARVILIPGCGPMACSRYDEVAAAMDRAWAAPRAAPLPVGRIFASLAADAARQPRPSEARAPRVDPPSPPPEPG